MASYIKNSFKQGRRHGFLSGGVGFLVFTRWVGVFFFCHTSQFCACVCVCVRVYCM